MPYCHSCGGEVDSEAQFCSNCGASLSDNSEEGDESAAQTSQEQSDSDGEMSEMRRHEYEKLADKSVLVAATLGLFLGPFGYVYIGNWRWAIINFFTLNYLFLGIILVPIHVTGDILNARKKLDRENLGYAKHVEFIENI